jgi:hypothetical protein
MMWLRGIAGLALAFLTGLFLIGGIIMLFIGASWPHVVVCFGFSFAMFIIRQAYDSIFRV